MLSLIARDLAVCVYNKLSDLNSMRDYKQREVRSILHPTLCILNNIFTKNLSYFIRLFYIYSTVSTFTHLSQKNRVLDTTRVESSFLKVAVFRMRIRIPIGDHSFVRTRVEIIKIIHI